jgi:outer membrane receptor for ferrienterochelin and colicins
LRKVILHIIFLLLVACKLQAANFILYIQEKESGAAVANASVQYTSNGTKLNLVADKEGKVAINDIIFPLHITCSALGFETRKIKMGEKDLIKTGQNLTYKILLEKNIQVMQDIVITGQNTPVLATQSVYKVKTISSAQIAQRAAISLNDVLNYEMNSFVSNDNILGSSLSIGGIGGQNVKILLNGIPVTGRENGNIDLGQINMNNVKRIEMIQGPMSVIYGSNALGGVINVITNQSDKKFNAGLRTYAESIGRYNIAGNLSTSRKNHSLQVSLARNFFQGWTPENEEDRFQLWKPKTQYLADLQYTYTFKKGKLNYYGSYLNEKITNKGTPIINPYEGYAFDEYYRTQRNIQSVSAEVNLNKYEKINLLQSYSTYQRTKNRFKKDLVTLMQTETKSEGDQDTTIFNNVNLRGTITSNRIKNLELLGGYEYSYESGKSYKLATEKQNISEIGLFVSSLYKNKKVNIQPSFRYIYNNRYTSAFTPALHTKFDISNNTQLRASYARGFRTPAMKELYLQFIDQNHTIIGNPDLKPEIGDHYEIGIEHLEKMKNGSLTLSVNAYHNEITNLIALAVYNNHGVLRKYSNVAQYNNWMMNTQAKWRNKHLSVAAGAGYIVVEKSAIIPQHAIIELSNNIAYTFIKYKAGINFNYKYNSKQPVMTVDNEFLYTNPLHIANVSFQKSLLKNSLQCQFGVKNLLNIQNTTLNGAASNSGSPHSSAAGMQLFPARSLFIELGYNF